MQIRMLKTFLEAARAGSFVLVAERLNMTLSAVSMQIKSLEGELGVTLFDRSHRPPRLTPIGATVRDQAERVVAAQEAMLELCRPSDRLRGRYRIGFVATASVRLLPDFLINARNLEPDARFDIETDLSEALVVRVRSGRLDAAVVTAAPGRQPDLHHHELRRERLLYAVPGAHREQERPALPFLHFKPHSGIGKLIAAHIETRKDPPARTIILDSVEAIMECVNRGIGFTLLPEPDIRRSAGPEVTLLEPRDRDLSRSLVLAVPAKSGPRPQIARILKLFSTQRSAVSRTGEVETPGDGPY